MRSNNSVTENEPKVHDARNDRASVNIRPNDIIVFSTDIAYVRQHGDGTNHLYNLVDDWPSMPQHAACVYAATPTSARQIGVAELADVEATQDDVLASTRGM